MGEDINKVTKDWLEVSSKIEKIGKELRESVINDRELPKEQYSAWLRILTGCYIYFKPLYMKYKAIKTNNEDAKFMDIKNNWKQEDGKFTSAVAERESSNFVAKYRYIRDWLEGWVEASDCGIKTCRNRLNENTKDIQVAKLEE